MLQSKIIDMCQVGIDQIALIRRDQDKTDIILWNWREEKKEEISLPDESYGTSYK